MKFLSRKCWKIAAASLCIAAVTLTSGCSSGDSPAPDSGASGEQSVEENVKLQDWMQEKLDSGDSVTEKEQAKWQKKVTADEYYSNWMRLAGANVVSLEESCYDEENFVIDYRELSSKVHDLAQIYSSVCGELPWEPMIAIEGLEDAAMRLDDIYAQLGASEDILNAQWMNHDFYVIKRLETKYSDTISGALQKEVDNLLDDGESSDWIVSTVDYFYGEAFPSDTYFIIHANQLNPFNKEGVYNLDYYDTGEFLTLVNNNGFQNDVPVFQLIENAEELSTMPLMEEAAKADGAMYWTAFKWLAAPELYQNAAAAQEKTVEISGPFVNAENMTVQFDLQEGFSSTAEATQSAPFLEPVATFYYTDINLSGSLYYLIKNTYLSVDQYGGTSVVGVSEHDGTVSLNFCYDADNVETLTRSA